MHGDHLPITPVNAAKIVAAYGQQYAELVGRYPDAVWPWLVFLESLGLSGNLTGHQFTKTACMVCVINPQLFLAASIRYGF